MRAEDIEAMEHATAAAVSPQAQEGLAGWRLPFDTAWTCSDWKKP